MRTAKLYPEGCLGVATATVLTTTNDWFNTQRYIDGRPLTPSYPLRGCLRVVRRTFFSECYVCIRLDCRLQLQQWQGQVVLGTKYLCKTDGSPRRQSTKGDRRVPRTRERMASERDVLLFYKCGIARSAGYMVHVDANSYAAQRAGRV